MTGRKNIIFDLGGVLLNLDIQRTLEAFRQIGLNNIGELFRIGHASSFFKQYETGSDAQLSSTCDCCSNRQRAALRCIPLRRDRKSTRLNSSHRP